ncbi:hypothetical protein SAMN02745246_03870, partial [Leeuwenhoekiella marinoflava DSM 3653]
DRCAPSLVRIGQGTALGEIIKAQMVDLALAGQHDTGYLPKRAATTENREDHSDKVLIGSKLFCVPVAVVLFSCPVNIIGFDEI